MTAFRGVPVPRVDNRDLAQWIEGVSQRLAELSASGTGGARTTVVERVGGGGGGGDGGETGPAIPTLDIPPKPSGVSAMGGLEKIAVFWANPFRDYTNHALARVYRARVDAFDQAVEIGQARYVAFIDENVEDDTAYWYWVRFESTASVLGPVSDSATAEATEDPATAIARVSDAVLNSPLTRDLYADVDDGQAAEAEIRAYGSLVTVLASEAQQAAIRTLETRIEGNLGPVQNVFEEATRAAALDAVDAYGAENPDWLAAYTADSTLEIELRWYIPQGG